MKQQKQQKQQGPKRRFAVGDKVWLKAHRVLRADGTYDHYPRIRAVVTEVLPDNERVPWVRFCRINMLDAPPQVLRYFSSTLMYTHEGALSRRLVR